MTGRKTVKDYQWRITLLLIVDFILIIVFLLHITGLLDINDFLQYLHLADKPAYNAATEVHFIDVGQGDATLVISDGRAMLIDSGDVDKYNDVETRIIEQERRTQQSQKDSKEDSAVSLAREQINDWGDDDAKTAMEELEESYRMAETEDEKAFVAQKMSNLGFQAMTSNFTWLRGFFMVVLAKPETQYDNPQKAEYWKSQGYQAIDNENTAQLRNAVFELLDLMTSSANQAISSFGADLTM